MAGRPPVSTYRVQLHGGFDFHAAAEVVDYLAALGVSHLYASPYLQAARGSTHGYDVVDHGRAGAELGGEDGRRVLVATLHAHGMGQLLDIVPNHMSVADPRENAWWWDVLRHGTPSPWAGWFDVDWDNGFAADPSMRGRLVLPVLGEDAAELDAVRLVEEHGEWLLAYHEQRFPVAEGTVAPGDSGSAVHDRQAYVLTSWRRGSDGLNYRRFFDIAELAAVRVEDARVFATTHERVLEWVRAGELDGLRIDHPDGLADPGDYLRRLADAVPGCWIVVEKILEPGERLPDSWPVAGTTGYDAMRLVGGLFVDPAAESALTDTYAGFTGSSVEFAGLAHELKLAAARSVLAAETSRLAVLLQRLRVVAEWRSAFDALAELLASFVVYRSYLRPGWPADESAGVLRAAVSAAASRRPGDADLLRAVERLALAPAPGLESEFVTRLQQTTGMVMAKGVEDTAFYRYHRLTALNEVGSDPSRFGVSVAEFHADCEARRHRWPQAMTALSTHDTKRSEDVRARLAVLSEIPGEWADAVGRWHGLAERHRGPAGPDANAEYLFWQTLVGAWPISVERLGGYLEKATREAKEHTSWVDPDPAYDESVQQFVRGVLGDDELMTDVSRFVHLVVAPGRVNSLAQKLVQLTMPGVPDVYQGSECWDLSLVDPDNRRAVDFGARRELLETLDTTPGTVPPVDDSGLAKLLVVSRALRLRRDHGEWFGGEAGYSPVDATGPAATHVVAFSRAGAVVTVVPRLTVRLRQEGGWRDTRLPLPPGAWRDVFTGASYAGGEVGVGELLAGFPVALLARG